MSVLGTSARCRQNLLLSPLRKTRPKTLLRKFGLQKKQKKSTSFQKCYQQTDPGRKVESIQFSTPARSMLELLQHACILGTSVCPFVRLSVCPFVHTIRDTNSISFAVSAHHPRPSHPLLSPSFVLLTPTKRKQKGTIFLPMSFRPGPRVPSQPSTPTPLPTSPSTSSLLLIRFLLYSSLVPILHYPASTSSESNFRERLSLLQQAT